MLCTPVYTQYIITSHVCMCAYVRMPKNVRNAWRGTFVIPYGGIFVFLVPQLAVNNVDQHAKILTVCCQHCRPGRLISSSVLSTSVPEARSQTNTGVRDCAPPRRAHPPRVDMTQREQLN